jgi:hypothetical protein
VFVTDPELLFGAFALGDIHDPGDRAPEPAGLVGDRRRDHERVDAPAARVEEIQLELLPFIGLQAEGVRWNGARTAGSVEEPGDRRADQVLRGAAEDLLHRRVREGDAPGLVDGDDALVEVLDEPPVHHLRVPERGLHPCALKRVPDGPAEEFHIGLSLDQVVLRAVSHRVERGGVFSRRGEHDDRDVGGRPAQAVEDRRPPPVREIEVEEHDVDPAARYRSKPVLGAFAAGQRNLAPALAKHLPEIAGTRPDQQHA